MTNEDGKTIVYLNGKIVLANKIDPSKHTFIGNFRPPDAPCSDNSISYPGIYICACGMKLEYRNDIAEHWREGHLDIPQYKSI